jgi:hypothetical protein
MTENYREASDEMADFTADKYAAREFLDEDPRVASTRAIVSEARKPRPRGYNSGEMHEGRQYAVSSMPMHISNMS